MKDLIKIEEDCREIISALKASDIAHDFNHTLRVVDNCKRLMERESADPFIVIISAWFHDAITLAKDHPQKATSSTRSAEYATPHLLKWGCDQQQISAIKHCIIAHSHSGNVPAETAEAKLLQDADRLDALGAIGLSRCLQVGGATNLILYDNTDPFCASRIPEDTKNSIDHFYQKLFILPEMLNTETAKNEAKQRVCFMQMYLDQLKKEIL